VVEKLPSIYEALSVIHSIAKKKERKGRRPTSFEHHKRNSVIFLSTASLPVYKNPPLI
jgi:hypothetical protein